MNDKALSARIYGLAPQSYEIYFTHCNNHGKISAPRLHSAFIYGYF